MTAMTSEVAAKAASAIAGDHAHVVYQISDGESVIYVGCTNDLKRRISEHKRRSEWWPLSKACTFDVYPTATEALLAERALIRDLSPVGNSIRYEVTTPTERDMEADAEISAAMFCLVYGGLTQ